MNTIRLGKPDIAEAARIACDRTALAFERGLSSSRGLRDNGYLDSFWWHLCGALGEVAFARSVGAEVPANRGPGGHDDVAGCEIKTVLKGDHRLIVRRNCPHGVPHVLVSIDALPTCRLLGWLWSQEAMRDEWLQSYSGRPSQYYVPVEALRTNTPPPIKASAPREIESW